MSILGYSTAYFLPQWWSENSGLWGEKLIPLWDWFLSNDNPEKDKMSGAFYQIVNKYINTQELPLEGLTKYIEEIKQKEEEKRNKEKEAIKSDKRNEYERLKRELEDEN